MKLKPGYIIRTIASETIVVPTGEEAIRFNGIMTLNKTGKVLFEALQKEVEEKDLVSLLTSKFEIDESTALKDVVSFINKLKEKGLMLP